MFALWLSSFLYILYDLLTRLWKTHPFIIVFFRCKVVGKSSFMWLGVGVLSSSSCGFVFFHATRFDCTKFGFGYVNLVLKFHNYN
jgi:hypothetical protein